MEYDPFRQIINKKIFTDGTSRFWDTRTTSDQVNKKKFNRIFMSQCSFATEFRPSGDGDREALGGAMSSHRSSR
jgi:hypothetical protein